MKLCKFQIVEESFYVLKKKGFDGYMLIDKGRERRDNLDLPRYDNVA